LRRYTLHSSFSIHHFDADVWPHSIHRHTYFEIIFILKGQGIHHVNSSSVPYEKGDVFLLGPEDSHYFEINEPTEFSFVRFNESQHRQIAGKRQTGESLKQYITKYKTDLIGSRLLNSWLTLTDIADEFGFSDESHLCKQFKNYMGATPKTFRKQRLI
jgi:hypothetical protein